MSALPPPASHQPLFSEKEDVDYRRLGVELGLPRPRKQSLAEPAFGAQGNDIPVRVQQKFATGVLDQI